MSDPVKIQYIKKLDSTFSRFVSHINKYHDPTEVITYSFLEGSDGKKQHVRLGLQKILDVVPGLKVEEVETGGDVRISFNSKLGSWSYIGTDIFFVTNKSEATMNIGWTENSYRVVVHEWCHTLNVIHEHMRGIKWDKPAVYDYYKQIGWDKAMVDLNLFNFNERDYDFSEIDADSIMMYSFPCSLTLDNKNCDKTNKKLSIGDISNLNRLFPAGEEDAVASDDILVFLKQVFIQKKDLSRLLESQLVIIANQLGFASTEKDLKSNTIDLIWTKINS